MRPQSTVRHAALFPSIAASTLAILAATPASRASDTSVAVPAAKGAAVVGGALPGGAIISARSATATPAAGGPSISASIADDGSFTFAGLRPGKYRLALASSSVPKQTQGATFGEKVNAGLHAAGGALSQGAQATKHDTAKNSVGNIRAREVAPSGVPSTDPATSTQAAQRDINTGMPNRISMNVTIAKRTRAIDVDGEPIVVDVGTDGTLAGRVVSTP